MTYRSAYHPCSTACWKRLRLLYKYKSSPPVSGFPPRCHGDGTQKGRRNGMLALVRSDGWCSGLWCQVVGSLMVSRCMPQGCDCESSARALASEVSCYLNISSRLVPDAGHRYQLSAPGRVCADWRFNNKLQQVHITLSGKQRPHTCTNDTWAIICVCCRSCCMMIALSYVSDNTQ